MSSTNWHPTHRTRAGVEVEATFRGGLWCAKPKGLGEILSGAQCNKDEFSALFELIPNPVTIPLDLAKRILGRSSRDTHAAILDWDNFETLLADAEREEAKHDASATRGPTELVENL